jgi:hypothetical protein
LHKVICSVCCIIYIGMVTVTMV